MNKTAWILRLFSIFLLLFFIIYFFLFTQLISFFSRPIDAPISDEEKLKRLIQLSFYRITGIPILLLIIEFFIYSFLLKKNLIYSNIILKINNISIIVLLSDLIIFIVGEIVLYNLNYTIIYQMDIIIFINLITLALFMLLLSIFIKNVQIKMNRRIDV